MVYILCLFCYKMGFPVSYVFNYRTEFFHSKQSQNLDLSYKMKLNFWIVLAEKMRGFRLGSQHMLFFFAELIKIIPNYQLIHPLTGIFLGQAWGR